MINLDRTFVRFFIGVNMDDTMFWMFVFGLGLLYLAMWIDQLSGFTVKERKMLWNIRLWLMKRGAVNVF